MFRLALVLLAHLVSACSAVLAQFETRAVASVPTAPYAIAVGDFNADGKLDLAVVDYYLTILLGNGDGTFRTGAKYVVSPESTSIVTADLRNNGILDLVVGDNLNDDIYVLLGNGDGTFQTPVSYPMIGRSPAVATGDFTGDGKLDIVAITNSVQYSRVAIPGLDQSAGASACMMRIRAQAGVRRSVGPDWLMRVRQVEFPSAVEADLICAVFDCEHPTEVTVPATESESEDPK